MEIVWVSEGAAPKRFEPGDVGSLLRRTDGFVPIELSYAVVSRITRHIEGLISFQATRIAAHERRCSPRCSSRSRPWHRSTG
jgi:hypothetical protein